ncbi:chemotaxis protein CheD [Alkalihalobacillus sp. TS-13]|uniref:chemotaxis protein CheD n=1 Tax=Alkalihalobacillus sp. TS-13 TaxID=2842455 RepID=UPI001C8872E5|nr:chemotaxis protein CheD [Alkalihalobacillus sp. TS-13]
MNKIMQTVNVKISDYQITKAPNRLKTTGLGSCVGIVIFEPGAQVAGMAHVMLPSSELSGDMTFNLAKYADTALPAMVTELVQHFGIQHNRLKAKIAGGAQMFQFTGKSEALRVGPRNITAVKDILQTLSIPVLAEDVGGQNGRTIEFDIENSNLMIRTIHKGMTTI